VEPHRRRNSAGEGDQRRLNFEVERLRGLEVDDHLDFVVLFECM
jgi:hypothetical protein